MKPELAAVEALAAAAREVDGVDPLSEATLLALAAPEASADQHHVIRTDGTLTAYMYLHTEDDGSSWAETVVHPQFRRHGFATRFLQELRAQSPSVRIWAHGDIPAAQHLAATQHLSTVRDLWVMSRAVDAAPSIESPEVPSGFTTRSFRPGDESEWLRVNSEAFAYHPEQGRMTLADLQARMAEPWFDPAGLLLVFDDESGSLAASHWTKIADPRSGVGEVYVVAVDPAFQGRGLGGYVTRLGLAHLRDKGVDQIELYVEGDNHPAIATYRRQGFERSAHDVQYAFAD